MAIKGSYHQHYHFIKQLVPAIFNWLNGAVLVDAFTTSKQELVLLFSHNQRTFELKVLAKFHSGFLLFENTPYNKGSNAQACFQTLFNQSIISVTSHQYNRSFSVMFSNHQTLIFKCYDALVNVVLVDEEDTVVDMFRESIQNDWVYNADEFIVTDTNITQKLDDYAFNEGEFWVYKREQEDEFYLSLTPQTDKELLATNNALEASTVFARYALSSLGFKQTKLSRIATLQGEIKRIKQQVKLSEQGIKQLIHQSPFEEIGHIIMANLHAIPKLSKQIELFDFYNNKNINIKLKADLDAAANAAYYYRKSKNKKIEVEQMEQKLLNLQQKLVEQELLLTQVELAQNTKQLKPFQGSKKQETIFPFKRFIVNEFEIWVGKNAANNDLLTQKYAHKNDMWLHAKGVTGSHTIIKHKAGKLIPNIVLTIAAQIAAYYSKHKGNTLAPVSYMPKKFVRKPKGAEPGQVVIDREEVMLVEPKLP
ncbi:MAG: DUF814 domain-containing protein [Bacteroidia bacterium]|nr:DUF814 domain-containing protein [Bacteroidia bacterium]